MDLSKLTSCGHCGNVAKMEVLGSVKDTSVETDNEGIYEYEAGTIYEILKCPACKKDNVVCFGWWDGIESEEEIEYKFLYPLDKDTPLGLPTKILNAYKAAEKVKTIDVNAYAILMRRLLELICIDRKAKGNTLAVMLKDLSNKNEIPAKLVDVANGLKNFGNIGAHAKIGELSEEEIPILSALITAILEYIYSAPFLASSAEEKLKTITTKNQKTK
jgi:hypothetical protein